MDGEKSKMWSVCLRFEVKTWDRKNVFFGESRGTKSSKTEENDGFSREHSCSQRKRLQVP